MARSDELISHQPPRGDPRGPVGKPGEMTPPHRPIPGTLPPGVKEFDTAALGSKIEAALPVSQSSEELRAANRRLWPARGGER